MPAPIQIFIAWCVLLPALCGIGFAAARTIPGPPERLEWSLAFWLGVAVTTALLAGWHLFFAIDGRTWALLGPLSLAGLLGELHDRREAIVVEARKRGIVLSCLAAFAFWLATRAALPSFCADDGLYYTQIVRWSSIYPAIPGLGNLQNHLAFNNGYHLLVAALSVGPFSLRGQHLANGLLLLAVLYPCAGGLVRLLDPRSRPGPADALAALLLGPAVDLIISPSLSCPVADWSVYLMGTGLLLAAMGPALRESALGPRRLAAVLVTCAGAFILKQSMICVAVPAAAFATWHWIRSMRPPPRARVRMLGFALASGAAVAGPWMAHGVITSGFPLYPAAWPDLGLPWAMERSTVVEAYRWVYAYARWPGRSWDEVVASHAWVGHWFLQEWLNNRAFLFPAALGAVGMGTLLSALIAGRRPLPACAAAAGASAAGLVIWWTLAPDTRFAGPLLWATAGLACLAGASAWRPPLEGGLRLAAAAGALALAAGAFLPAPPLFVWSGAFPPPHHNRQTTKARLASDEVVEVAGPDGCWDPPCTRPPLDPRLRLRNPGDWSSGFTVAPQKHRE